ncbi:MAG: phage recombination protein Bet [Clostridia bacterium]|nr:phage recombination protein Bet [Clostridia bacterium]
MSNENKDKDKVQDLVVKFEVEGQEVKLSKQIVQEYIVGTEVPITNQEFKLFTELCKVRKLNPFLREAYLIKYKAETPAQLVVGKDAILKRAVLNPNYDGMECGIIVQKEDGSIEERQGTFKLGTEQLVGGWARVFRKDWTHPTYSSVSFNEVAQRKNDGSLNSNWSTKGATMVEKVAKVRALRETFVEDLAGMYEAEEIQQDIPQQEPIEVQADVIEQTEETKEVSMNEL